MQFQNIRIFPYQKTLLQTLLLLVFKIVESLQSILKDNFNPFVPNSPFLYLLIRGVEKECITNEWVNVYLLLLWDF